jgi:hypothetical protein
MKNSRNNRFLTAFAAITAVLTLLLVVVELRGGEIFGSFSGITIPTAETTSLGAPNFHRTEPVFEGAGADPFNLDAWNRQQYLGIDSFGSSPDTDVSPLPAAVAAPVRDTSKRFVITGGADGVRLEVRN